MSLSEHYPKLGYSVREAAKATGISRSSMYALVASGKVHSVSIAGRKIIPATALRALIESGVA